MRLPGLRSELLPKNVGCSPAVWIEIQKDCTMNWGTVLFLCLSAIASSLVVAESWGLSRKTSGLFEKSRELLSIGCADRECRARLVSTKGEEVVRKEGVRHKKRAVRRKNEAANCGILVAYCSFSERLFGNCGR